MGNGNHTFLNIILWIETKKFHSIVKEQFFFEFVIKFLRLQNSFARIGISVAGDLAQWERVIGTQNDTILKKL
jgi:hypothetical protein